MPMELGILSEFYSKRTDTSRGRDDPGLQAGARGPGTVALANRAKQVIQPMVRMDPTAMRSGQGLNLLREGMPLQALSGVDIALWDITGKVSGLPIHKLIGGAHRSRCRSTATA